MKPLAPSTVAALFAGLFIGIGFTTQSLNLIIGGGFLLGVGILDELKEIRKALRKGGS